MSNIKRSDQVMGTFGILFSLILILFGIWMVSLLIEGQQDFNDLADETCADSFFGCTAEEEEEIDEFMEKVQSKVVIWQTLWAFAVVSSFYLTYTSFRLASGTNLFRGLMIPEGHTMYVGDRSFFVYSLIAVTVVFFGVGLGEVMLTDGFYDDINDLGDGEETITEEDRSSNTLMNSNGGISGSCTSVFLFLILIIAFFTRGPGKTEELPFIEATRSDGDTETSIDDLLGITNTTEEQTDEE